MAEDFVTGGLVLNILGIDKLSFSHPLLLDNWLPFSIVSGISVQFPGAVAAQSSPSAMKRPPSFPLITGGMWES